MNNNQIRLFEFANNNGLPYILSIPKINEYKDDICFLLVGSTATGLCDEYSDVDIALICEKSIYDEIALGERWNITKPCEVIIDNIQLHYYGVSLDKVINKMNELDDNSLYIYSNGIVLLDTFGIYKKHINTISFHNERIQLKRLKTKLHLLIIRSSCLKVLLEKELDKHVILGLYLEVMTLSLKVIALLDKIEFDPRKRLYNTALRGKFGCEVIDEINVIYEDAGKGEEYKDRIDRISKLMDQIIVEAKRQGVRPV